MAASSDNRPNRKRKSEIDLIFEINDGDCSPSSSPGHSDANMCNNMPSQSDLLVDLTSNDSYNLEKVVHLEQTNKVIILSEEENSFSEVNNEDKRNSPVVEITDNESVKCLAKKLLFSIKFCDKEFAEVYKQKIIQLIMGLFNYNLKQEVDDTNLEVKFLEDKAMSDMDVVDGESDECAIADNNTSQMDVNVDQLFILDTTPASKPEIESQPKFLPRFEYDAIDDKMKDGNESKKNCARQSTCFNCDGPHSLKDCPEPRDHRRIQQARNNFKNAFKQTRYHLDEEQKYGHYTPGKISEKLRLALNLGKYDIPNHVYHMRRVGYSPGWLEMAKVTSSNIKLFDFHGSTVNDDAEQETVDPEKVIEYAGFNMPLEKGFKDKHKERGCPAYNVMHSKEAMLTHIKQINAVAVKENQEIEVKSKSNNPQLTSSGCESDSNSQDVVKSRLSRDNSPSLTDLELKKKQILDLLNDGNATSPQTPIQEDSSKLSDINNSLNNSIKSSTFGTPIIKTCSPFERLPCSEKFSKDISQVINFENLPDSTGKYEQMSQVISKVRKVIKYNYEDNNKS